MLILSQYIRNGAVHKQDLKDTTVVIFIK